MAEEVGSDRLLEDVEVDIDVVNKGLREEKEAGVEYAGVVVTGKVNEGVARDYQEGITGQVVVSEVHFNVGLTGYGEEAGEAVDSDGAWELVGGRFVTQAEVGVDKVRVHGGELTGIVAKLQEGGEIECRGDGHGRVSLQSDVAYPRTEAVHPLGRAKPRSPGARRPRLQGR